MPYSHLVKTYLARFSLLCQRLMLKFLFEQPQKVKFQLRLGQSEPIYDAIKIVQNSSSWPIILYRACKRTVEGNMSHLITKYRFFEVLSCSFTYDLHRRAMSFMLLCTVRQTLILLRWKECFPWNLIFLWYNQLVKLFVVCYISAWMHQIPFLFNEVFVVFIRLVDFADLMAIYKDLQVRQI